MATNEPPEVHTLGDVRADLSHTLRQFASLGADAPEVFFGRHRKPEGVVISYDRWRQLTGKKTGAQPRASTTPPRRRQEHRQPSRLPGKGPDATDPDLLDSPASELSIEEIRALRPSNARRRENAPDGDPGVSPSRSRDSQAPGHRSPRRPSSED